MIAMLDKKVTMKIVRHIDVSLTVLAFFTVNIRVELHPMKSL
jgi:hypothetical protein